MQSAFPDMYAQQSECLLFTKVPREVRDLIWAYAVGCEMVCMRWCEGGAMGCPRLEGTLCECGRRVCVCMKDEREEEFGEQKYRKKRGMGAMGVLTSCRAV